MSIFPPKKLSRLEIEALLVPGTILRIEVEFPPDYIRENKHMVIVGFDPFPLLLKIGTEPKASPSGKIYRTQFGVKKEQYGFLKYTSILNCGKVWKLITKDEIIDQVFDDNTRIEGMLSDDHKSVVCQLIDQADDISQDHRRIIKSALRNPR